MTLGKKIAKGFFKNVGIGLAYRYQSALPTTPFAANSDLVLNWDVTNGPRLDFNRLNTTRGSAVNSLDLRIDKKWFFQKFSLNVYLDIQNINQNVISQPTLLLDRPLDGDMRPIGGGVIVNPDAPIEEQRYATKLLDTGSGTVLPTLGLVVEF